MGAQGADTVTAPYTKDTSQLGNFIQTAAGAQYASLYAPGATYTQVNSGAVLSSKNTNKISSTDAQGTDVSAMLNAYQAWASGNAQAQTNWQAYADKANANAGGQGDQTITTGPAVGQRAQLLGALAGQPTTPTPGLGSMGTLTQNGMPVGAPGGKK